MVAPMTRSNSATLGGVVLAAMLIPHLGCAAAPPAESPRSFRIEPGVRVFLDTPAQMDAKKPTLLVIYATPNGNSIEQTWGAAVAKDDKTADWRMDIQHVGAQIRLLRSIDTGRYIVVAVIEADGKSWPAWRAKHAENSKIILGIVDRLRAEAKTGDTLPTVILTGHSGGGSFTFGFLNGIDAIPDFVERIALLDSNYAYTDEQKHGDKLIAWLNGAGSATPTTGARGDNPRTSRRLVTIAYDDREIMLDGKKVVGPTGGTWRASQRMLDRFTKEGEIAESKSGEFVMKRALNGRAIFFLHPNPQNKILHTALVGEMNGLIHALTWDTPLEEKWGKFGGPRAYTRFIDAAPATRPVNADHPNEPPFVAFPPRARDATTGSAFIAHVSKLTPAEREQAIVREILAGNVPDHLRRFKPVVPIAPIEVRSTDDYNTPRPPDYGIVFVLPDYLSIGSNEDFVRMPMTPMSAQVIADKLGCALMTPKLSDVVYQQAELKLEPKPLTKDREAPATFLEHHRIIEQQRAGKPAGLLIAGIKKDVVITNRLKEKPNKVAIYGWHKLDSKPIQPLTIVHKDTYVDYSHGVRLVAGTMLVERPKGQFVGAGAIASETFERAVSDVLRDPTMCKLISDEGVIEWKYRGE